MKGSSASGHREQESISVVEENLQVGVRKEATGKVRAVKTVNEENVIVSGAVTHEELDVERISLNQVLDTAPPPVRYEGDTTIIPVVREEVVVQTRLVLVEEVRITRRQVEKQVELPVTLRKEEIRIEREGGKGTAL